jgi:hypothetical protein
MQTVRVEIPRELVLAAGLDPNNLSAETARLLALELYRGDRADTCMTDLERDGHVLADHGAPVSKAVFQIKPQPLRLIRDRLIRFDQEWAR